MSEFTKKCMAIRTLSDTASGWSYISLLILTFLNRYISVIPSLINIQLGDFVNLGVLPKFTVSYLVLHGLKSGNKTTMPPMGHHKESLVEFVFGQVDFILCLLDRRLILFEGRIKLMLNYLILITLDNILVIEYF